MTGEFEEQELPESNEDEIEIVEEDESNEDEEDESEEEVVEEDEEVEYEGKKYKVPKELKDALLRQSDYTRKTQEVAEQRKAVELQRQQAEEAIKSVTSFQKDFAELNAIDHQLKQLSELDWNEAINENPVEAMKLQSRLNELRMYREQVVGNIQQQEREVQAKREEEFKRQVDENRKRIQERIPNWSDEVYRSTLESGRQFGFTDAELRNTIDSRYIETLYYAKIGREAIEKLGKKTPAKPIAPSRKVTPSKPAPKGLDDKLSTEDWMKRRQAELRKASR